VAHEDEAACVSGLAGPPSLHRGNRAGISVFVNGRWVQSRPLIFAAVDAYHSELPIGRHPVTALSVRVPDDDVDVNVHPAKAEVRFRDERAVGRAVRRAVAAALETSRAVSWTVAVGGPLPGSGDLPPARDGRSLRQRLEPPAPAGLRGPQPVQERLRLPPGARPERAPAGTQRDVLPLLRVVGQLAATYVVAEGPDGMYLVDQHAAHERVTYDRLVAARAATAPARQPLLEPVLAELDVLQAGTLEEHRGHLAALGLEVEPFGETAYLVRQVPAGIGGMDIASALRALLDQLASDRRVADPFGRAAATIACHASVRAGMALAMEEMRKLIADLEAAASPRTCPHGRPTVVHLANEALERQFRRR
jgi:DNA mismatch repair protein MutL